MKKEELVKDIEKFIDNKCNSYANKDHQKYVKLKICAENLLEELKDLKKFAQESVETFKREGSTLNQLEQEGFFRGINEALELFNDQIDTDLLNKDDID